MNTLIYNNVMLTGRWCIGKNSIPKIKPVALILLNYEYVSMRDFTGEYSNHKIHYNDGKPFIIASKTTRLYLGDEGIFLNDHV